MVNGKVQTAFDENYQYFQQIARAGRFSVPWWSAFFYARLMRRNVPRAQSNRVLEVGCGFGWVLENLERDYETFGMDISAYAIRFQDFCTCQLVRFA